MRDEENGKRQKQKRHEEQRQRQRQQQQKQERFRGEIVLVLDGVSTREKDMELMPTRDELKVHIQNLMTGKQRTLNAGNDAASSSDDDGRGGSSNSRVSVRNVVDEVVQELGVRKKLAYKLALEVQLAEEMAMAREREADARPNPGNNTSTTML